MPQRNYNFGEKALIALSCKQEISWLSFRRLTDQLIAESGNEGLANGTVNYRPYRLLRLLDSLGHCDYSFSSKNRRVVIAPPMAVRLPLAGAPQAVLAGARSGTTHHELKQLLAQFDDATVEIHADQSNRLAPPRILISSTSSESLETIAEQFGVHYSSAPPAWTILSLAGSIDQYRETLNWEPVANLGWPCRTFDSDTGRFLFESDAHSCDLVSYTNPTNNARVHFYRKKDIEAEIDRDWGRYLVLQDLGKSVVRYDERKAILGVRASCPLPRLYARGLTLCSGYASFVQKEDDGRTLWRYFRYVPSQIAELVEQKLAQKLVQCSFNQKVRGES